MISEAQKQAIKAKNKHKSHRQDYKQHCQKILEGIGRFDDNTASRAVWELLQNARDLSEHAHVKLALKEDRLVFSHNGDPFIYDTFTSLIKQVSSEGKEDPNAAGQFGTGFMTTHKFSRKIRIDGCMMVAENEYAPIENFTLDRTASEIQDMITAMEKQLDYAEKLIDQPTTSQPTTETSFTYYLDEEHYPAAKQGIDNAVGLLPYVMTINDRIEKVQVTGGKVEHPVVMVKEATHCIDGEIGLYETIICSNGVDRKYIYHLQSKDRKDIVILPLQSPKEAQPIGDAPRFFIFFPLLGTQDFGLNYIFHSERFYPEEPRNAIVLPEDNVDKRFKFEKNVEVLNEMTEMLFRYLDKYGSKITDARHLAVVDVDGHESSHALTKRFYEEIRSKYINKFQSLPLITLGELRVSVDESSKVRFLAPDIVSYILTEEGSPYFDVVYDYACQVAALPQKGECLAWSKIVGDWNPCATGRFVTIGNIVNSIQENKDKESLYQFLEFLKTSKQLDGFQDVALFPNREGKLKSKSYLRDASEISETLYRVSKPLIYGDTDRFVDESFSDLCDFTKYGRDDLKKSINDYVNGQKDEQEPFKDTLNALLDYCSIFPVQNGSSTRNAAMPLICELFGHTFSELLQPPLEGVEADKEQNLYRNSFDVLVEFTLRYIEKTALEDVKWFANHKDLHFRLLNSLCNKDRPTAYQTETFLKYAIFPNESGELRKEGELNELVGLTENTEEVRKELYSIYNKVFPQPLEDRMVDVSYAGMCAFEKVQPKNLCRDINESLSENGYSNPVVIEIIDLLDKDDSGCWKEWFKVIDDNKANIFLSRLKGSERASTYKFMKADANKKAKLLALMDRPDFDEIIKKAEDYIRTERERNIVFNHMLSIGKEIEKKLRTALDENLLEVQYRKQDEKMEVGDIQNGQDIVIKYRGKEIFFIEVKSKWSFDEPAHMSTNQMRQAVLWPDNYALCCVELSKYNSNEVESLSIETILDNCYDHLDIGNKLSKLLKPIVDDNSDAEMNVKIYDYKCDLKKGFFTSSPNKGLQPLVDAIISKA